MTTEAEMGAVIYKSRNAEDGNDLWNVGERRGHILPQSLQETLTLLPDSGLSASRTGKGHISIKLPGFVIDQIFSSKLGTEHHG